MFAGELLALLPLIMLLLLVPALNHDAGQKVFVALPSHLAAARSETVYSSYSTPLLLNVTITTVGATITDYGCGCGPPGNGSITVVFNGTVTGGRPPYSFSWSFGDGTASATNQQPTHVYTRIGYYANVTLTVKDSQGDKGSTHYLFYPPYESCPSRICPLTIVEVLGVIAAIVVFFIFAARGIRRGERIRREPEPSDSDEVEPPRG